MCQKSTLLKLSCVLQALKRPMIALSTSEGGYTDFAKITLFENIVLLCTDIVIGDKVKFMQLTALTLCPVCLYCIPMSSVSSVSSMSILYPYV